MTDPADFYHVRRLIALWLNGLCFAPTEVASSWKCNIGKQKEKKVSFPDSVTVEIRRRAHFQCCLCKAIGVEIHHIIPEADGGPDTLENAAPLCPSCHETYGANPTKRKFIREARALWFEICASRYASDTSLVNELRAALSESATKSDISELKSELAKAMAWLPQGENSRVITVPIAKSGAGEKQWLGVNDLLVLMHSKPGQRPIGQVELLCMKELWPVKGGWRHVYNEFAELFGSRTLRILASQALDNVGADGDEGLFETEITAALKMMHIEAVLITGLEQGNLVAQLMKNGEIGWLATKVPPEK